MQPELDSQAIQEQLSNAEKIADLGLLQRSIRYYANIAQDSNFDPQKRVAIFTLIREYTHHENWEVREIAQEEIQKIWENLPLYKFRRPREDRITSGPKNQFPVFHSNEHGGGSFFYRKFQVLLVTLLKAHREGRTLTWKEVEEKLIAQLGESVGESSELREINEIYTLPSPDQYQPLVTTQGDQLALHPDSLRILQPYIPVLFAISSSEVLLQPEEIKLYESVKHTLDRMLYGNFDRWQKNNYSALKQSDDGISGFSSIRDIESRISMERIEGLLESRSLDLDDDLFGEDEDDEDDDVDDDNDYDDFDSHTDEDDLKPVTTEKKLDDQHAVISLIDDASIVTIDRNQNPYSRTTEDHLKITAHWPQILSHSIIKSFFGRDLDGPQRGSIDIKWNSVTVLGEYLPTLPEDLYDADTVKVSVSELSIQWNEITPDSDVNAEVIYAKSYGQSQDYFSKEMTASTVVSGELFSIVLPNIIQKGAYNKPFEITFDQPAGSHRLTNGTEAYSVTYEVREQEVLLMLQGSSWNRTLTIPRKLDSETILSEVNNSVNAVFNTLESTRPLLEETHTHPTNLDLAEQVALLSILQSGAGLTGMTTLEEVRAVAQSEPSLQKLKNIQSQIDQLDDFGQWAIKVYISTFIYVNFFGEENDNTQQMFNLINSRQLDIPATLISEIAEYFEVGNLGD